MNKGEILKGLSEVQHELQNSKEKLDKLVSTKIWDETIADELARGNLNLMRDINSFEGSSC